jgi:fructoselysine-6-P-deglycase FrlB-like protein
MGRPYAAELKELNRTYDWALDTPVESLADSIDASAPWPLIAVGSGGSLTAAHFACHLHSQFMGRVAQVLTPYELLSSAMSFDDLAVLILSAGGRNPDVLACADSAAARLPRYLTAITTSPASPLGRRLQKLAWPALHAFDCPTRKDGFLATNSLLATLLLLARAYTTAAGTPATFPPKLADLAHPGKSTGDYIKSWSRELLPLLRRQTLVVLHGASTKPAAADIESRFTEAALGTVQIADYRNFAHGRHHWLAVNARTSAVLSLSSPVDRNIANRTLALIPKEVPRLAIDVDGTVPGIISSICKSMYLAEIAGSTKGIDPGRPHVPMFGRKLYHLSSKLPNTDDLPISKRAEVAIQRKSGFSRRTLAGRGELEIWMQHYNDFLAKLSNAQLDAVIFDYDGTLCGPQHRFDGPSDAIIDRLKALLKTGLYVGIATGRGKSVRDDLQKSIRSRAMRRRVLVAYHNGAEVATLDDDAVPPNDSPLSKSLAGLVEPISQIPCLRQCAKITAKGSQISIELSQPALLGSAFEAVSRLVRDIATPGISVVSSTHSIDVLAPGISKLLLLKHIAKLTEAQDSESRTLCIGDRGRWPGNDADLLNHPLSLSVDQVSDDPRTCWNLSSPGQRYDLACLEYLRILIPKKFGARINVKDLQA